MAAIAALALILLTTFAHADPPACPGPVQFLDVGTLNVRGDIAVDGRVMVTTDNYGLSVWDLTDPLLPQLQGSWRDDRGGYFGKVRLGPRGFAYAAVDSRVGDATALEVFDVRSPGRPLPFRRIPGDLFDFDVSGGWLVTVSTHLSVYDARDPFSLPVVCDDCIDLELIGDVGLPGVAVRDGLAVIATWRRVRVVDLSDPSQPFLRATVDFPSPVYGPASPKVWLGSDRAVIAASRTGPLVMVDLGNPDEPTLYVDDSDHFNFVRAGALQGTRWFAGWDSWRAVRVYDLTQQMPPQLVGQFPSSWVEAMAVHDGRLYLETVADDVGIQVLDIGPLPPVEVGRTEATGQVVGVAADAELALVTTTAGSVTTLGLPSDGPGSFGGGIRFEAGVPSRVEIEGSLGAVQLSAPDRVVLVDVADPMAPVVRGTVELSGSRIWGIALSSGRLAVAVNEGLLGSSVVILDVSAPDSPVTLASIPFSHWVQGVALRGDLAAVAGRSADAGTDLLVVDVSDVTTPVMSDPIDLFAIDDCGGTCIQPVALALLDGAVIVGARGGSLVRIDLSDPMAPVETWRDLGRSVGWLEASGDVVAVGAGDLQLIGDFGGPAPTALREFRTDHLAADGALAANTLLLASNPLLELVRLRCEAPSAGFEWHRSGPQVWFEDLSGYSATFGGDSWDVDWDLGDGSLLSGRALGLHHEYPAPGSYEVTQTVTNEWGADQLTRTVIVDSWPLFDDSFESGSVLGWNVTAP